MCFRIFNFEQIKMIFRGDENLKKSLLQMQMFLDISNLIKTDKYLEQTAVLV